MIYSFDDVNGAPRLYSPAGLTALATSRCGHPAAAGHSDAALARLCDAFEAARPGQTTFGKFHAQAILLDALAKSLRLADAMQRLPEIGTTALPNPVFIVAPFRTGTTFLHRLLSCDPHNRSPRMWEVAYPPPAEPHLRGDVRYFAEDGRVARAAAALRTLHRASPALSRLHPMTPDSAEECFGLLETSLLSHSFMFYAELPSYFEWLDARDGAGWRAAYQIYADQLQLLHWWYPGRRWVLKSPVHLWNLEALLKRFPQAYVIQLHRDPVDAMSSFCRLLAAYRDVMWKTTDPVAIGEQVRDYTRKALNRAVAARRKCESWHFIDVEFADLIREPIATVQAIYARMGAQLVPEAAAAMLAWLTREVPGQRSAGARIETFGLGAREVRDMFEAYAAFLDAARARRSA